MALSLSLDIKRRDIRQLLSIKVCKERFFSIKGAPYLSKDHMGYDEYMSSLSLSIIAVDYLYNIYSWGN